MYRPCASRRKAIEEVVKDLSPGVRELAKEVINTSFRKKGLVGKLSKE